MKASKDSPAAAPLDAKLETGVRRVIVLASGLIVFSILLIGSIVYALTEREVVSKLKTRDLFTLASSISTKVDARIERAVETSMLLANDPLILAWLEGGEQDETLGRMVRDKTEYLVRELDYSTTFIASTKTRQYWDQHGTVLDTISKDDPFDVWFFEAISSSQAAAINFDYNKERGDTFAFVNALAGDSNAPAAVLGVGMNLSELSAEFATYAEDQGVKLWLVDREGSIYLSDDPLRNGKLIDEFLPPSAISRLQEGYSAESSVFEYDTADGERMDVIRYPLRSTHLNLLLEVERKGTVAFLQTIRWNTILAVIVSIVAIVFFFFYVSRKLANPYKRALELNHKLEAQVALRTKELSERNEAIIDSINYARLLQQSVMPKPTELSSLLEEPFMIWSPRDLVGGDFYWVKRHGDYTLAAVGDCTGHGVPGAFMTMLAISSLDRIVETSAPDNPAEILERLHRLLKETLHQVDKHGKTDDGLSLGLCSIGPDGTVVFAGASCILYRLDQEGVQSWKGDRRGIGYRRTPADYSYTNHLLPGGSSRLYLSTDGFFDQNGGERGHSFGRSRFEKLLEAQKDLPAEKQREQLMQSLTSYMAGERQRDDISVLSFRIGTAAVDNLLGGKRA